MTLAFFPGCKISYYCPHYARSTKSVLKALGVDLVEPEFSCCGYPVRNYDMKGFLLQAARNFAIAERLRLHIVTPCKCCFGTLSHARHMLNENKRLRDEINGLLQEEGLKYIGVSRVRHLLSVLAEEVGAERIGSRIKVPLYGLKVAVHYGCHALRPSSVTGFDNPFAPRMFEALVEITGAQCVDWAGRLECCGQPIAEENPGLSRKLADRKFAGAAAAGADVLCSACTYCQIQFDRMPQPPVPVILYPQLLEVGMGMTVEKPGQLKEFAARLGTAAGKSA